MSGDASIAALVVAVFSAWQKAGINFLVLRNYENLPHRTSNDIDVLIAPAQLRQAERVLLAAAGPAGYRLHNRAEFVPLALYLSGKNSGTQVHFDLFTALKWRGFEFLSCREFLRLKVSRELFSVPHPAHEAAANLLASFIYTGRVKEKYRPGIAAAFRAQGGTVLPLLAGTYGRKRAQQLVELGAREKWEAIEREIGSLRRALILRQLLRRPGRTLGSLLADGARLSRRFVRPTGLAIVLCGPDGCGKSTLVARVCERLGGTFPPQRGRHIHWKPRVFSRSREGGGPVTDPHGSGRRNPVVSLAYFAFHWLEFFLGWLLRVRPVLSKGGLVVIERFYYDFFVDQQRYRLRVPRFMVRGGYVLLPKPDLVFLLDAPVAELRRRKQEVPLEETARQRGAYVDLVKTLRNGFVIDASQPPEMAAADIEAAALDFLAVRTAGRRSAANPGSE